jgi:hypothetical protein
MDIIINSILSEAPEGCTALATHGNFFSNLFACLGDPKADSQLIHPENYCPVADLLRRYHNLEGDEWLIASPIHWQATHNDAMIMASGEALQLYEEESRLWFAAFKDYLSADNINVHYHDPVTWLLQCPGRPAISSKPVYSLHHQSMMSELKQLDPSLFWARFMTDMQMFFSSHPLNRSRKADRFLINGVWVWGGGTLVAPQSIPLVCYDSELLTLAGLLSTKVIDGRLSFCDEKNVSFPYHRVNPSSLRPAASPRDPEIQCQSEIPGSRGLAAGRRRDGLPCDMERIQKNSLLLFQSLNETDRINLQEQFKKNSTRWYWNNRAYRYQPKNWLSRLLKRI